MRSLHRHRARRRSRGRLRPLRPAHARAHRGAAGRRAPDRRRAHAAPAGPGHRRLAAAGLGAGGDARCCTATATRPRSRSTRRPATGRRCTPSAKGRAGRWSYRSADGVAEPPRPRRCRPGWARTWVWSPSARSASPSSMMASSRFTSASLMRGSVSAKASRDRAAPLAHPPLAGEDPLVDLARRHGGRRRADRGAAPGGAPRRSRAPRAGASPAPRSRGRRAGCAPGARPASAGRAASRRRRCRLRPGPTGRDSAQRV